MFCQYMVNIQTRFLSRFRPVLARGATPVPAVGDNLLTFLANRLSMSFVNLDCQDYGLVNPVTVTLGDAGAAVAAVFDTTPQKVHGRCGDTCADGAGSGDQDSHPEGST
jgi:hypothetical protein